MMAQTPADSRPAAGRTWRDASICMACAHGDHEQPLGDEQCQCCCHTMPHAAAEVAA